MGSDPAWTRFESPTATVLREFIMTIVVNLAANAIVGRATKRVQGA